MVSLVVLLGRERDALGQWSREHRKALLEVTGVVAALRNENKGALSGRRSVFGSARVPVVGTTRMVSRRLASGAERSRSKHDTSATQRVGTRP